MSKLDEIREESRQVADKIDALRAVESEDAAVIEQRDADLGELMKRAEELETSADAEAKVLETRAKLDAIVNRCSALDAPKVVEKREVAEVKPVHHHKQLRAFKDAETAYRCGQFISGYVLGNDSSREWCERNDVSTRAMGSAASTNGAAFVDDELSSVLIRNVEEQNEVYSDMQRFTMSSDTLLVPKRTGGIAGQWLDENTEISTADATASQVTLNAKKYTVATRVASELLADSVINLADMLVTEFATTYTAALTDAAVNGDGSSSYGGIVGVLDSTAGILASGSAGSVHTTDTGNNLVSEITTDDFTSLLALLPKYAHANARFYCSPFVYHSAMQRLDLAQGVTSLQVGAGPNFLGYPVTLTTAMPGSSAGAGDVAVLFGDASRAGAFGVRKEFSITSSTERFIEFDQTAFYSTLRAAIKWYDLGSASAAGPMVAMKLGAAS